MAKLKFVWDKKEEEEEKEEIKLGSQFGGGFGLSDLVKETEEDKFQKAYKEMAAKMGLNPDPDDPKHYYDYRALYKETGKLEPDKTGHFPSKFKLEGHPQMIIGGVDTKTGEPIKGKDVPDIKPSTKLKFTADVGIGAKAVGGATLPKPIKKFGVGAETEIPSSQFGISDVTTPEKLSGIEKGIIGLFGTWEAKKRAMPELQKIEDFGNETLREANQWAEELKGPDWVKSGSAVERVAIIYERLTGESRDEALTEIKSQKDLNIFFVSPPKKYKEAVNLRQQLVDIHMRVAEPGKDIIGQFGWVGLITAMGFQVLPLISKLPSVTLNKIAYKIEGKTVKGKELVSALRRVRYPEAPGIGKPSILDKKIFAKFTEEGGLKTLAERMKGITITEVTPRFAFGTKLYAGLPADEMVKSLVKTSKITADIARELSLAKPELVSQVIQQLSIASPAIASKLAPELVKLIPEIKPEVKAEESIEIPKVEPKEPEKEFNEFVEKLNEEIPKHIVSQADIMVGGDKNAFAGFGYGVKSTITELNFFLEENPKYEPKLPENIKNTIDIFKSAKVGQDIKEIKEEVIPKAIPKAPTKIKISEKEIIPATLAEAKEILKVDIKKPSPIKDKLAEQMVAKKVSLTDIEAVKGEKIDVSKPKDIFIALRDIKAVEKEVAKEPTPKAIPKELAGLAEEAKPKVIYSGEGVSLLTDKDKELIPEKSLPKGTVFRGVNSHEFSNIIETGKIKSAQEYNLTGEEGRTLFANNYETAKGYASGFLPSKYRDEFFKQGEVNYVLEIINSPETGLGKNKEILHDPTSRNLTSDYATTEDISINNIKSITELKAVKGNVVERKLPLSETKTILGSSYKPITEGTKEYTIRILEDKRGKIWYEELGDKGEPTGVFNASDGDGLNINRWLPEQIERTFEKGIKTITVTTPTTEQPAVVEAPAPIKAEVVPKPELASPTQISKAHAIADSKALISEKGKMKPQYRKIAEVFTGKRSVKDMTPEEAEMFIDMLNRLPEPKYRAGKLVAPSIPRTMKLTTQDFFKKKYGEPTPIWLLTDQTYYATKLGIKPLVEPFEKGKMEFDLEFRKSSNLVDRMVNKLNQVAKTSMGDRIKSKIKNIPTKVEAKMAELVNKHEATPSGLSEKEADVFKYFRNLSKDIWRRENEVREKVDLPPIKYKTAYFRHTADAMAKEMLEGKYPFPQGIKYWGEKMVGKKIFNPMEFHRKLSDDLIDLWSKDIRAVTKSMLWNGLKEIYLAQPAKFLNEQLNAISKDLPEYKNLSPRDQAAYDQTRVIPSSTKKWLVDYINQVIKGQETELDASLNRIVTKNGLKGIFDKALVPFGRSIGRKPITNTFMLSGRAVISGVMGWVPRQIMRNSFQPVQNLALYGLKATIKAYLPASIDKNLVELMSESLFLKSYTGYEELPTNLMAKLEKVWLGPYGIVAVNNAKLGMKAAYWNILELIKNPKFKKHGWADPQRTKDTPKDFLYPSEKEKLLKEMEFGASATQYQYIPMGMPGVFRYKALVPLTRLQSWWMNYFTKFLNEAKIRGLEGKPSWSGEDGPTLPWSRRVNFLKYLILGGALLTALGYRKSFMLGVAPTYLSPAGQVALGFYNYVTADADWKREKALKQIYYSWKAFIPGSLAWRDFIAVWNGEKELEEILFYGKKEEKKVQPPLKITIPKNGKLEFTGPKLKIESKKLKFTF